MGGSRFKSAESDEDDDRTGGLVGLENLGNTCYMNATLQVLSNCSQLTELLIYHPTIIGRESPKYLSIAYRDLLFDIWYSKHPKNHSSEKLYRTYRPPVATPKSILRVLRESHPIFRGFGQHDSQEFMRTFLNVIHEELKIVPLNGFQLVIKNEINQSSTCINGELLTNKVIIKSDLKEKTGEPLCEFGDVKKEDKYNFVVPPPRFSTKTTTTLTPKSPSSIVTDVFQGSLMTSIKCLSCGKVSTRPEVFLDLSLPLTGPPLPKHQEAITQSRLCPSPSKSRSRNNSISRRLPSYVTVPVSRIMAVGQRLTKPPIDFSTFIAYTAAIYLWIFIAWLQSWIWSPHIALHDCLNSFFSEDELNGENKYSCEHCSKRCNGIMHFQLLQLPEVLCLHLKRFRHEFMNTSKITSCVEFPLRDLDLSPYLHPSCPDKIKLYDLIGVVCHSGSVRAGHYYSYAFNKREQSWYEYDDTHVSPVDQLTVASSLNASAYILVYKKQEEMMAQTRDDRHYLESSLQITPSTPMTYISRRWHLHFELFAEPGPVDNSDFLCSHGALQPLLWDCRDEYTDYISQDLWNFYINRFGGGPLVKELKPCTTCTQILQALEQRRLDEKEFYLQESQSQPAVFVISQKWFTTWTKFVSSRRLEPPGPIDNTDVLEPIITEVKVPTPRISPSPSSSTLPTNYRLRRFADHELVSEACWRYFHSIYGGGPEHAINFIVANNHNKSFTLLSKAHSIEAQPLVLNNEKEDVVATVNGWDDEKMDVDCEGTTPIYSREKKLSMTASLNSIISSSSKTEPIVLNRETSVNMWDPEEVTIVDNTSNASLLATFDSNTPDVIFKKPDQSPSCNGDSDLTTRLPLLSLNGENTVVERGSGDCQRNSTSDEQHLADVAIDVINLEPPHPPLTAITTNGRRSGGNRRKRNGGAKKPGTAALVKSLSETI